MGRNIPDVIREKTQPHNLLSLAFMCLTITATLAVVSALCGTRFRRKNKSADQPDNQTTSSSSSPPPADRMSPPDAARISPNNLQSSADRMSGVDVEEPLPPPPARRLLNGNGSQSMRPECNGGESANRLSSVSMRAGRSLSMSMRWSRKDAKMKGKLEKEDSVWMKTIILGERCKVEDEDDPVIFDQRGVKVTAYHPKVPSSLPVSRTSSYIDPDAVPATASNVIWEKDRIINEI